MKTFSLVGLILLSVAASARAVAPKVAKATPDDGDAAVDPKTAAIVVVFDQPMDTQSGWSVCGGGETFPKIIGRMRWGADAKTFTMRVKLKPGRDYALSINCPSAQRFQNPAGEPCVAYPISFHTSGERKDEAERVTADDHRQAIEILRDVIANDYSHFDLNGVDWGKAFDQFGPAMEAARSPEEFAEVAATLIGKNRDIHTWLKVGDQVFGTTKAKYVANYNMRTLERLVPEWTKAGEGVFTGKFEDGIGYLCIASFDSSIADALDAAYAMLPDAKGLIIDVRPNGGGDEDLAMKFAGCFIDQPKLYAKQQTRLAGKFSPEYDRMIEPNKARPAYRGKVVLLTGPGNMSSAEDFVMMMRTSPNCTTIGGKTYGASGNPKSADLGNGVVVYLSSWRESTPDGKSIEGVGISPDVTIDATPAELKEKDPILEAALKEFTRP